MEAGPTIGSDDIAEYGGTWKKVLVLMTDGENTVLSGDVALNSLNGTSYSAYGFATAPLAKNRFGTTTATLSDSRLDEAMLELGANIKETGIEIYTVAFRVNSSTIINNLKACATSEEYYSYAADGTQLSEVFTSIAESVKAKMVYLSK